MNDWKIVIGMPSDLAEKYLLDHHFSGKIRVIRPGEFTTCDHVLTRINLNVDENDVVRSIKFG